MDIIYIQQKVVLHLVEKTTEFQAQHRLNNVSTHSVRDLLHSY